MIVTQVKHEKKVEFNVCLHVINFSAAEIQLNTLLVHKINQVSLSSFLFKRFLIVGELRYPLGNPSPGRGEYLSSFSELV